jgi:hypothetical protein
MRESGWDNLFDEARQFCDLNGIPIPNMAEEILVRGRSRRDGFTVTNLHHYRVGIFYVVLDKIWAEMNHRFTEATTELLMCFSCLIQRTLSLVLMSTVLLGLLKFMLRISQIMIVES